MVFSMDRITIAYRSSITEGYRLSFQYDQRIIEAIKAHVPKDQRTYDPATKRWTIWTESGLDKLRWAVHAWADVRRAD